jgi:hypothetical protein
MKKILQKLVNNEIQRYLRVIEYSNIITVNFNNKFKLNGKYLIINYPKL